MKGRLLLLLANPADNAAIASWLEPAFEIVTTLPGNEGPVEFDLCITDVQSLGEHLEAFQRWRERSAPTFVPFLLLATAPRRAAPDGITPEPAIDDLIVGPVSRATLERHVAALMRVRSLSLAQEHGLSLYRALTRHTNAGIYMIVKNRFAFVNAAAARIFGRPPEALIGLDALAPFAEVDRASLARSRTASPDGQPFEGRVEIQQPNGPPLPCEIYEANVLHMGECATFGSIVDVSGREREAALQGQAFRHEEAMRLRSAASAEHAREQTRLFTAVSHELRTPLTNIKGNTEFMQDELGGTLTPQQREFVEAIAQGVQRMEVLVNDLLDYTRIEADTFRLEFQSIEFASLMREVARGFLPLARANGLELVVEVEGQDFTLQGDRARLHQVLANLIDNALRFSAPGSAVEVLARAELDKVVVEVVDHGIGIADDDLPKLFKEFSQLEAGKAKGGVGIGLAICRTIVDGHHGTIGATSVLGKGSTFRFELPRHPRPG